ncbi:MAG TPA: hypothetical protein PLF40_25010, partial [Kofleriaceae bacterium]|nr:hypothetical protein [Kofleriaceae bacterium]
MRNQIVTRLPSYSLRAVLMSSVLLGGAGVHAAPLQRHTAPMHTVAATPSAATRVADAARYQAVQKRTP